MHSSISLASLYGLSCFCQLTMWLYLVIKHFLDSVANSFYQILFTCDMHLKEGSKIRQKWPTFLSLLNHHTRPPGCDRHFQGPHPAAELDPFPALLLASLSAGMWEEGVDRINIHPTQATSRITHPHTNTQSTILNKSTSESRKSSLLAFY